MNLPNVLIQAIGLIGTFLFFLSFQFKNNKVLFRIQLLSYIFYTIHLLLLGAITGAISYILNSIRSFCLGSGNKTLNSNYTCAIICVFQLITLYFTYTSWISILPIAANIAATIAGYSHNPRKIRDVAMFINSPLWVIYDIIIGSWAGVADELASTISIIISIFRYGWKNLDHIEQ